MARNDENFEPNQRLAAELLAQGRSKKDTAEQLGVGLRTIFNWLEDEEYKSYLKRVEAEYLAELRGRFFALNEAAISTYEKVMSMYDTEPSPAVRVATNILKSSGIIRNVIEVDEEDIDIKVQWDPVKADKE